MLNKLRLLTPGPTPLPEEVRLALARDMLHHRKAGFRHLMDAVQARLKILFGTDSPVLPLACSGTGAMTAAAYCLFAPGEKVGVINGGKFGERWLKIAQSRGLDCEVLEIPWGQAVTPAQIEEMLRSASNLAGIFLQQSETSTGVLMPIREIAALTRQTGTLLVVDGISGVGISPAPMDEWGIDCLLTGSQKGLMLPPGLALIALSPRAWQKAERVRPGCFYFDLVAERKNILKSQTNFTTPVNLIMGLEAALEFILKNGLRQVYQKQWALTMLVRKGAEAMGLGLYAREHFAWGVTSINMPPGVDGNAVLKFAEDNYGVVMAGGQDKLKGKIARLGHMGWVDWADCLAGLYALKAGIQAQGGRDLAAGDITACAMRAYAQGLEAPLPL